MDLKVYFRRVRETEAAITEDYPIVVSTDTGDGGRAGALSEVTRHIAACLIAEGRAELATEEQREAFRTQQLLAKEALQAEEMSRRLKVAIVSDQDLRTQLASKRGGLLPGSGK